MKLISNILPLLITLLSVFSAKADGVEDIMTASDSAYVADDFCQAIAGYNQVLSEGQSSSELYYNLGNAYYRNGNVGQAIVAYERALKLDPTNSDARFNLKFVKSTLVDKQSENMDGVSLFFSNLRDMLTPNQWAWTGCAIFLIMLCMVAIYLFTKPVALRKVGFFGSFACFFLSIGAFAASFSGAKVGLSKNDAVVISNSAMISTAPRPAKDRNEEVALLHEGTKIGIIDSLEVSTDSTKVKWMKVKLPSGHQGWAVAHQLEVI